jgi:hypothetical protein
VLRLYGVALTCVNVVAFVYWSGRRDLARIVSDTYQPICWPFWENCHEWRVFGGTEVAAVLWAYLALTIATGACFFSKRTVGWGWLGLLAITAIRTGLMFQDFTLRLNQHYMANWVALAFLFLPARRALVPALLVSFYFWAGILKLDMEWLSGAALYGREKLWVPDALVAASCVYVVVLEVVLIFGLYSRRAWLFWTTIAQLVIFHIWSWPIVGFFYPMLMFGLDSIFVLAWLLDRKNRDESEFFEDHERDVRDIEREIRDGSPLPERLEEMSPAGNRDPSPISALRAPGVRGPAALLLAGFAITQMLPKVFPGDEAITGEGRLFALNMFDARVVCQGYAIIRTADGKEKKSSFSNRSYAKRIACDPVLYFNLARNECRRDRRGAPLVNLDLHLRSRRTTDAGLRDVIDIPDFCTAGVTYDMWRPNDWILK